MLDDPDREQDAEKANSQRLGQVVEFDDFRILHERDAVADVEVLVIPFCLEIFGDGQMMALCDMSGQVTGMEALQSLGIERMQDAVAQQGRYVR